MSALRRENAPAPGGGLGRGENVLPDNVNCTPLWRAVARFRDAILDAGFGDPGHIVADGEIHRFRAEGDKPGAKSGWYSLHLDGLPAGVYGSWREGRTQTWCAVSRDRLTPAERADIHRLVERARAAREAETRDRQDEAARRARAMWDSASPANLGHAYLIAKQIGAHGIRQRGPGLLVPVYVAGTLTSLQTIYGDGTKRFLSGGRVTGGCHLIDDATRRPEILVSEGLATGATLHEEIGAVVYIGLQRGQPDGCVHAGTGAAPWRDHHRRRGQRPMDARQPGTHQGPGRRHRGWRQAPGARLHRHGLVRQADGLQRPVPAAPPGGGCGMNAVMPEPAGVKNRPGSLGVSQTDESRRGSHRSALGKDLEPRKPAFTPPASPAKGPTENSQGTTWSRRNRLTTFTMFTRGRRSTWRRR